MQGLGNKAGAVESYFGVSGQSHACLASPTSPIVDRDRQRWHFRRHSLHLPAIIYEVMDTFLVEWYLYINKQIYNEIQARDKKKNQRRQVNEQKKEMDTNQTKTRDKMSIWSVVIL